MVRRVLACMDVSAYVCGQCCSCSDACAVVFPDASCCGKSDLSKLTDSSRRKESRPKLGMQAEAGESLGRVRVYDAREERATGRARDREWVKDAEKTSERWAVSRQLLASFV